MSSFFGKLRSTAVSRFVVSLSLSLSRWIYPVGNRAVLRAVMHGSRVSGADTFRSPEC